MNETTGAKVTLTAQPAELRRHPIRGILWSLLMGIGLVVVLVVTKVISLDLTMMIVVMAIALFVGVLWSTVGPARAPKGPPPATVTASTTPASSRFDDFDDGPSAADTSTEARTIAMVETTGDVADDATRDVPGESTDDD